MLHAGGKFGGDESGYHVSGGLHGVGISVVNALSDSTEVTVWRGDREFRQEFSRGAALAPMTEGSQTKGATRKKGTRVRFKPDPTIFKERLDFDPNIILSRMKELAFLNSTATFTFRLASELTSKLKSKKKKSKDEEKDAASDEKDKLKKEAQQYGADPNVKQPPYILYVSAAIGVLVVLGGKGILY